MFEERPSEITVASNNIDTLRSQNVTSCLETIHVQHTLKSCLPPQWSGRPGALLMNAPANDATQQSSLVCTHTTHAHMHACTHAHTHWHALMHTCIHGFIILTRALHACMQYYACIQCSLCPWVYKTVLVSDGIVTCIVLGSIYHNCKMTRPTVK